MVIRKTFLLLILLLWPVIHQAEIDSTIYKYWREIKPPTELAVDCSTEPCIFYLEIDEELYTSSPLFLSDLRVIRNDGQEVRHVLGQDEDIVNHQIETKEVQISSSDNQEFILDLGEERIFHNKLKVVSESQDYHRSVNIWGADQIEGPFKNVNLSRQEPETISLVPGDQDLFIEYKFNDHRYLKVKIFGGSGDFEAQSFLQIFDRVQIDLGDRRYQEVMVEDIAEVDIKEGDVFLLSLEQAGVWGERLDLNFIEGNFARDYILYSSNKKTEGWTKISEGQIFKNAYQEGLTLDVFDDKQFYKLVVGYQDDTKLHLVSANFESLVQKLYFLDPLDFGRYNYKLYYGSTRAEISHSEEFILPTKEDNILLKLGPPQPNTKFSTQDIGDDWLSRNWLYFLPLLLIIIVVWFVFKILQERKHKDKEREGDKFVSKL